MIYLIHSILTNNNNIITRRSQDIKSSKKVQILTIDPDDRAGLTDSDSAISDNEIVEESTDINNEMEYCADFTIKQGNPIYI